MSEEYTVNEMIQAGGKIPDITLDSAFGRVVLRPNWMDGYASARVEYAEGDDTSSVIYIDVYEKVNGHGCAKAGVDLKQLMAMRNYIDTVIEYMRMHPKVEKRYPDER